MRSTLKIAWSASSSFFEYLMTEEDCEAVRAGGIVIKLCILSVLSVVKSQLSS